MKNISLTVFGFLHIFSTYPDQNTEQVRKKKEKNIGDKINISLTVATERLTLPNDYDYGIIRLRSNIVVCWLQTTKKGQTELHLFED